MGMRQASRPEMLGDVAGGYAATIVRAVQQEYPNDLHHPMASPHDRPLPREIHPAFYGCYDWHSCVEMHWAWIGLGAARTLHPAAFGRCPHPAGIPPGPTDPGVKVVRPRPPTPASWDG